MKIAVENTHTDEICLILTENYETKQIPLTLAKIEDLIHDLQNAVETNRLKKVTQNFLPLSSGWRSHLSSNNHGAVKIPRNKSGNEFKTAWVDSSPSKKEQSHEEDIANILLNSIKGAKQ